MKRQNNFSAQKTNLVELLVEEESINDKDTTKSAPSKLQQLTLARGGDCEDK